MSPKLILVHSFKGGTGKTLMSINLADYLVNQGNRVLLVEADFVMPAFKSIFTKYNPDIYFNDFLNTSRTDLDTYIYPSVDEDFGIVFCNDKFRFNDKVNSTDQSWFLKKKRQLENTLEQLDYDYVVVDGQPSIHLFTINTIVLANQIVLMLRPDMQSISGTKTMMDNIYTRSLRLSNSSTNNIPEFNLVFNQLPNVAEVEGLVEKWEQEFTSRYDFIKRTLRFYYQDRTAYSTALEKFILDKDDPTKEVIAGNFSFLTQPEN